MRLYRSCCTCHILVFFCLPTLPLQIYLTLNFRKFQRCISLSCMARPATPPCSDGLCVKVNESFLTQCPVCSSATSSIEMFGLSTKLIDRAVDIRRSMSAAKKQKNSPAVVSNDTGSASGSAPPPTYRKRTESFGTTMAEASYLLLSSSYSPLDDLSSGGNSFFTDGDFQRTGRWTEQELEFIDFLLKAFDKSLLPIPHGVRLNDFLCQVLLCKGSRLTKKMKNAKLSSRSYDLKLSSIDPTNSLDYVMFSTLQEQFLESITNEASKLELRFNLIKTWRMHFSNLCVQIGCNVLDSTSWLRSLEHMERTAAKAEESIRMARRKRMGLALKADVEHAPDGVFFAGVPFQRPVSDTPMSENTTTNQKPKTSRPVRPQVSDNGSVFSCSSYASSDHDVYISNMLDMVGSNKKRIINDSSDTVDEFAGMFDDLIENPPGVIFPRQGFGSKAGTFLDSIVAYIESNDIPFQHVDVWVPSMSMASSSNDSIRLNHAGHTTRSDVDPVVACQLVEYGEYSLQFSFSPGRGLPGRVFVTNKPNWETRLDEADPKYFFRAGGAKIYGVKTALGVPLKSKVTGCVVVVFYSTLHIQLDQYVIDKLTTELIRLAPEPKWKLVVDVTSPQEPAGTDSGLDDNVIQHVDHRTSNYVNASVDGSSFQQSHSGRDEVNGKKDTSSVGMHSPTSSREMVSQQQERQEDLNMARILGECMSFTTTNDYNNTSGNSELSVENYISLRLLLLRPPDRRSNEENGVVEVLRKSFNGKFLSKQKFRSTGSAMTVLKISHNPRTISLTIYAGYSQSGRWTDEQLIALVVKDWMYLRVSITAGANSIQAPKELPPSPPLYKTSEHKCHVLSAPNFSTFTSTGAPTRMPILGNPNNSVGDVGTDRRGTDSIFSNQSVVHNNARTLSIDDSQRFQQFSFSIVDDL